MGVGLKFWQGSVAAQTVFPLQNNYRQKGAGAEGICTAAALFWARKCLELGRAPDTWAEIGKTDHTLNIIMTTLRTLDSNPVEQTELAGLNVIGRDQPVDSIEAMMELVKLSSTGVAIFWNAYHTMGYRYSHLNKDFFDMNYGAFRCKYSRGIANKFNELYPGAADQVIGCRIVSL